MRVPVGLSQRFVGHFAVAALNGALPALCGTFPVLGGVWRRSMELSHHSVGHSGREDPRPSSGSNPDLRGQTPCTPPPPSAHRATTIPLLARTQIVGTHPQRLLSTEKIETDE